MRKAASIARGAWSETSEPIALLSTTETLISPRPRLTGNISFRIWSTYGSCRKSIERRSGNPIRRSGRHDIASCTAVPATMPIAYA